MPAPPEPVEFSIEDAILNTWVEESGEYLQLETSDQQPPEPPDPTS